MFIFLKQEYLMNENVKTISVQFAYLFQAKFIIENHDKITMFQVLKQLYKSPTKVLKQ